MAFSLLKKIRRPEVVDGEAFMFRALRRIRALEWMAFNTLFHLLGVVGTPTKAVRYESLAGSSPRPSRREANFGGADEEDEELAFVDGTTVTLGVDHTVAGNPMRSRRPFELKADHEWRTSMRPA